MRWRLIRLTLSRLFFCLWYPHHHLRLAFPCRKLVQWNRQTVLLLQRMLFWCESIALWSCHLSGTAQKDGGCHRGCRSHDKRGASCYNIGSVEQCGDSWNGGGHSGGFTVHSTSGVRHPGAYRGLIEKIPYLIKSGVTAVELMPVREFNEASVARVNLEFKEMVRALHQAGIEVIFDVVFNYTAEADELD